METPGGDKLSSSITLSIIVAFGVHISLARCTSIWLVSVRYDGRVITKHKSNDIKPLVEDFDRSLQIMFKSIPWNHQHTINVETTKGFQLQMKQPKLKSKIPPTQKITLIAKVFESSRLRQWRLIAKTQLRLKSNAVYA
ncbi:hypothetical protein ZHAS_00010501 [Anopheles sinensis]|uniref:Uncharacterized protein n=1 Tax=Anopheles sinensis TaxID=74873 RepID=A0A084VXQ4_ANOSI|nr:hypothetical protein ZHAS_00010501 [Anopheles sinensis]